MYDSSFSYNSFTYKIPSKNRQDIIYKPHLYHTFQNWLLLQICITGKRHPIMLNNHNLIFHWVSCRSQVVLISPYFELSLSP